MIEKLASLLRLAVRGLEEVSGSTSNDTILEESEEQPATSPQIEPAPPAGAKTPPPPRWQRLVSAERARLRWLRSHPYAIGIAIGLATIVVIAEQWLIRAWGWLISQARLNWPYLASHRVALIAVVLALVYLIFGLQWLRSIDDFVRWIIGGIRRRPRLSALVGGFLLLIALWIASNYGTWVVLPFSTGQIEATPLTGETAAAQLISELNQVGTGNPPSDLTIWKLQEPHTSSGSVLLRRDLPLEECDAVLRGPSDFITLQNISLPRVRTGSQSSRLDLGNLSIGTINIPSGLFTQFILKTLPTGYREFNGHITEHKGVLEISVVLRNPSNAWRVAGPSDTFPEMMEYLSHRIALDLNPELIQSSGLKKPPADQELAFAMGTRAFRQRRYRRAWAFFELADQFASNDKAVNAMRSLTCYNLALEQFDDAPCGFEIAIQAMESALRQDPNDESNLLRPYLACLYYKAGLSDQAQRERDLFTQYLRQLETQDFDVRVDVLKQLRLRGPGRHLSATDGHVVFVDQAGAILRMVGEPLSVDLSLTGQNPRQIGTYGESNLIFISPDGAVLIYDSQANAGESSLKTLIDGRALSGVQQFGTSSSRFGRINLFLLNRSGKVHWCELSAEAGRSSSCSPLLLFDGEPTTVRQIFPVEDMLYMLATDGTVWHAEVGVSGRASTLRKLIRLDQVQEIFVSSDDTLYLLHDNGTVKRYFDDGRPETEDLALIDPGTGTAQIFVAGNYFYLLKSNGAIWRISNPRNPTPNLTQISIPPEDATIQEMFVTSSDSQDTSNTRIIYLLTDQRVLLRGTDTGDARVTFAPAMPAPGQTTASQ